MFCCVCQNVADLWHGHDGVTPVIVVRTIHIVRHSGYEYNICMRMSNVFVCRRAVVGRSAGCGGCDNNKAGGVYVCVANGAYRSRPLNPIKNYRNLL